MKKIFALLPMIAAFALTGCGDNEKESDEGEGVKLELTEEQSKAKVKELAQTQGLEITFHYEDGQSNETSESTTVGVKDNFTWVFAGSEKTMWREDETNFYAYQYNEESSKFEPKGFVAKASLGELSSYYSLDFYTLYFYMGSSYEGYHKVKDFTYVGRSATEYKLSVSNGLAYVNEKVIIDKETGITLYWGVEGADIQGNSGSASFEVTSFKTGATVNVPAHD